MIEQDFAKVATVREMVLENNSAPQRDVAAELLPP